MFCSIKILTLCNRSCGSVVRGFRKLQTTVTLTSTSSLQVYKLMCRQLSLVILLLSSFDLYWKIQDIPFHGIIYIPILMSLQKILYILSFLMNILWIHKKICFLVHCISVQIAHLVDISMQVNHL